MARSAKPWFYRQTGWWMCYLGGSKVRLAKGKKNLRAAKDRLAELRYEAQLNPTPDDPQQTIASVIETYLEHSQPRISPRTLGLYKKHLHSFAEAHGWRSIEDAKPLHLDRWLHSHKGWKSDTTKAIALRSIQVAFNWARRQRLIRENPFWGISQRPGPRRRNITPDEFQALLRGAASGQYRKRPTPSARFRQLLIFLYRTGCRPSEATKLQWSHIDFERNLIILPEHKTARTQRFPQARVIPLDPVVVRLLHTIRTREEGGRVFLNHRRTPWRKDTLVWRLKRARDAAGLPPGDRVSIRTARFC
jgi:integrase